MVYGHIKEIDIWICSRINLRLLVYLKFLSHFSVPAVIHEDLKTVYQTIHLKGAIDGLESFSNKFRNAKSQFFEPKNTSITQSIGVMPPTERCTGVGTVVSDSDADSSLGILKEDEMPG